MEDQFVLVFLLFGIVVLVIVMIILYIRNTKDNKQNGHRSKSIFKNRKRRSTRPEKKGSSEVKKINKIMTIDFSKYADGLAPCVIQDYDTKTILMLGFMNQQALKQTELENKVTFFSRSKQRLWTKGETSGNFLIVKEILTDCDNDTILIKAEPVGPVCHTGADTCFGEENKLDGISYSESSNHLEFLDILEKTITERKNNPTEKSYTASLFAKGINKIAQKVGEEAVEIVIEAKDNNPDLFKGEAADLLFHYLILLQAKGFILNDIVEVLKERNK